MRKFLSLLLVLLLVQIPVLSEDVIPSIPTRPEQFAHVFDYADVISARDEAHIASYCDDLNKMTKAAVVCVTVNSLEGMGIRDFAFELMNSWGIGDAERNDGVLLLLAAGDREIALEVGSGLDRLLDSDTSDAIFDICIHSFSKGDYSNGMRELALTTCLTLIKKQTLLFDDPEIVRAVADIGSSR